MSLLDERTFRRNSFEVKAVRVNPRNMKAVAEWCGGEVKQTGLGREYVGIATPKGDLLKAFVGYWITTTVEYPSYRVYKEHQFLETFTQTVDVEAKRNELEDILVNAVFGEHWRIDRINNTVYVEDVVNKILALIQPQKGK